eukprot:2894657-Rhodomonas_salina.7
MFQCAGNPTRFGPAHFLHDVQYWFGLRCHRSFEVCYAMSGSDVGHAADRHRWQAACHAARVVASRSRPTHFLCDLLHHDIHPVLSRQLSAVES